MPFPKKSKDNIYVVVDAGDFHFGAGNDEKLGLAYSKYFNGFIENNCEDIDMVVISGDLFHKELRFSSLSMRILMENLSKTVELCEAHNIQLRILKGTATHDHLQLSTVEAIFSGFKHTRVITTVTTEEVFPGFNVLYIPEEYPKSVQDFYADTIFNVPDQTYDMVFFHGTMDFQSFSSQLYESEMNIESAPVFKSSDMIRITKGVVSGGHIHTACNFKSKIFYHGSFSRTAQGEPAAKGFNFYQYDQATGGYDAEFIENEDAPVFKKLNAEKIFEDFSGNVEFTLKEIDRLIANPDETFRLTVPPSLTKQHPELKRILMDYSTGRQNLNLEFAVEKISPADKPSSAAELAESDSEVNELSFLTDQGIEIAEKIVRFAKIKMDKTLKLEDVQLAISAK